MKYICSLLTSQNSLNFTPADVQEATVDMVASGRSFLLRIETDDGQTAYGHANFRERRSVCLALFGHAPNICRAGRVPHRPVREPPLLFRLYYEQVTDEACLAFSTTSHFFSNEVAFSNLLNEFMNGCIIHESQRQLCLAKDAIEWSAPNKKFPVSVPAKRTLSPEQRQAAQELLNNMTSDWIDIRQSLCVDDRTYYDFDRQVFDTHDVENGLRYRMNAGFVSGSAGCGRRRSYAAAMSVIAAGQLTCKSPLSTFNASRVSAIVCKKDAVAKWVEELQDIPTYVIENEEDFDQCSYAALDKGGVVIFCTDFSWCDKQEEDAIESLAHVWSVSMPNTVEKNLSVHQFSRMHVNLKNKESIAIVRWVQFRMIVIDDLIDIASHETSQSMADAAYLPILKNLRAQWTWIHLFTPTPVSHLTNDVFEKADVLLNIPHRIFSKHLETSQLTPRVFSCFDATFVRMKTPGAILRKVTLIPVSVRANEDELCYIDNYRRMQQSLSPTPLPRFFYRMPSLVQISNR
jgi:hypothetical protein